MQTTDEQLFKYASMKADLLSSLLFFTQTFYFERTGREFIVDFPAGRKSHIVIITDFLEEVLFLKHKRSIVNVEPGSGKSEILRHFVAWAFAHYPDCQFIYNSYSKDLAMNSTTIIKDIMQLPTYQKIFRISLRHDSSAKAHFKTNEGGAVYAAGGAGTITGFDAGLPVLDRFSGALIMDDMHKPSEVHSDVMREEVKSQFTNTLVHRARSAKVPFIFIGQRTHEDDLPGALMNGLDGHDWHKIIIKSIDDDGNVLNPRVHDKDFLEKLEALQPYEFYSQYQQEPQPAGGTVFKPEWFTLLDEEPEILSTFITGDTAETNKTYNDPSVFSFWGLYKIKIKEIETDIYGLHWIDCVQDWVEPKDLEQMFFNFYASCMRYPVKPTMIAIEKKSTGVTLSSVLQGVRGLNIKEIERTAASGSKTVRFLEMQPFIAQKCISLPANGHHTKMCIDHMSKITLNDTHRHDDIADTAYDGIKLGLIDKIIPSMIGVKTANSQKKILDFFKNETLGIEQLKRSAYYERNS